MSDPRLDQEKRLYTSVKEKVRADDPQIDERTLADTVEGLTGLTDLLAAIVRAARKDEADMAALKITIDEMTARYSRFKDRAARRRQIVRNAMDGVGMKTLTMPDFTASLGKGPVHLVVIDEERIPPEFFQMFRQLDKNAVSAALKN